MNTPAGKWEDYSDLARYGWRLVSEPRIKITPKWRQAIRDLGISEAAGDWNSMIWKHSGDSKDPEDPVDAEIKYPATNAEYKLAVNPSAGIIVVYFVESPAEMRKPGTEGHLVLLHRFSDIAWLVWSKHCHHSGADPAKLRYILSQKTVNDQTLATVGAITHVAPENVPKYPGELFAGSDKVPFQALVGSPNGLGVAYLLLDHKKQLGARRRVQSVRVWGPSSAVRPVVEVLFTLDEYKGAIAGDKRPADDSSDEGGNIRPPPGRKPQGSRRSRLKGKSVGDSYDVSADSNPPHQARRRSSTSRNGGRQKSNSASQEFLAPYCHPFDTPSGSSRSGISTPSNPFAGGSSGGGSSGTSSQAGPFKDPEQYPDIMEPSPEAPVNAPQPLGAVLGDHDKEWKQLLTYGKKWNDLMEAEEIPAQFQSCIPEGVGLEHHGLRQVKVSRPAIDASESAVEWLLAPSQTLSLIHI